MHSIISPSYAYASLPSMLLPQPSRKVGQLTRTSSMTWIKNHHRQCMVHPYIAPPFFSDVRTNALNHRALSYRCMAVTKLSPTSLCLILLPNWQLCAAYPLHWYRDFFKHTSKPFFLQVNIDWSATQLGHSDSSSSAKFPQYTTPSHLIVSAIFRQISKPLF